MSTNRVHGLWCGVAATNLKSINYQTRNIKGKSTFLRLRCPALSNMDVLLSNCNAQPRNLWREVKWIKSNKKNPQPSQNCKKATAEFPCTQNTTRGCLLQHLGGYYWPYNEGCLSSVLVLPEGIQAILSEKYHCFSGWCFLGGGTLSSTGEAETLSQNS